MLLMFNTLEGEKDGSNFEGNLIRRMFQVDVWYLNLGKHVCKYLSVFQQPRGPAPAP
jgi:hypothetical protein